MRLTHFQGLLLFAVVISAAFAFLSKHTARERARYFLWSLFWFVTISLAIGWLMYAFAK